MQSVEKSTLAEETKRIRIGKYGLVLVNTLNDTINKVGDNVSQVYRNPVEIELIASGPSGC